MQFSITVKNGIITEVNKQFYFTDISKLMALELLGETRFPGWEEQAAKTLTLVTRGAGSFNTLVNTELPATATLVYNTIIMLEGHFREFQKQYHIPQVLENGIYEVTDVAILVAELVSKRR